MLYHRKYPQFRKPETPDEPATPTPEPQSGTPDAALAELAAAADAAAPALDVISAVARLAELQEIFDADGKRDWQAIQAIARPLGVKKHPDGWDSSLLRIIEAEYSAEIAAALAQEPPE
jgi:hypothetical protein